MESNDKTHLLKLTIETYGHKAQLEMLNEEATELALATRKVLRKNDGQSWTDLNGEIADVEIMIEQYKIMYPNNIVDIENIKQFKLNRLKERIEEATNG